MPRYEIKLYREVITSDEVTRVIEAPDHDAALDKARELCSDYNMSCPDDAKETGDNDCRAWEIGDYEEKLTDAEPDEVVEGDGDAET